MPVLRNSGGFGPMNGKGDGFGGDARCPAWPRALLLFNRARFGFFIDPESPRLSFQDGI
jgi:hypothetical protein